MKSDDPRGHDGGPSSERQSSVEWRTWQRRYTSIDMAEIDAVFHKEPFPCRGDRGQLADLRDSIRRYGLIQPLLCRVVDGKLQIVCGYRRWLAAQVAGVDRMPVMVARLSDAEAARIFEEENSARWHVETLDARDEDEWNARAAAEAQRGLADPTGGAGTADPTAADLEPIAAAVVENDAACETLRCDGDAASLLTAPERGAPAGAPAAAAAGRVEADADGETDGRVAELFDESLEIFGRIRADGRLPQLRIEALCNRIFEVSPVRSGTDIRRIGERAGDGGSGRFFVDSIAAHSLRVALLCRHYAESLGWTQEASKSLVLAGLLHDVGMLFVSEDDYLDSMPLNRRRREALMRHTTIGEALIGTCWPGSIAGAARDHHERWDGTGYPAGKRGAEVSLLSRIVGFIDAYAAMVCRRPYRSALRMRETLRHLRESTQLGLFDPAVEKAFLEVFSSLPIGLTGKLPDGTRVRVRQVCAGEMTHCVDVIAADPRGDEPSIGRRWFREIDLERLVLETDPAAASTRAAAEALAEIP